MQRLCEFSDLRVVQIAAVFRLRMTLKPALPTRSKKPSVTVTVWFLTAIIALACRYSVRDTGFVDLGADPFRVVLTHSGSETVGEELVTLYRRVAIDALADSNVEFGAERQTAPNAGPTLLLTDGSGRHLDLARAAGIPIERSAIQAMLRAAVESPRRAEILRETLRAYAVVIVIEGSDAADNLRVHNAVNSSSATIERLLPSMPKPVDVPPKRIAIPIAEQLTERELIWGLGFDPQPSNEARLAIVYGRGRRLGSVLEGALITRTALQDRLAMIGQDCECDLDRAWLKGPVLPGRWDRELQDIAARTLGFDPENPLVRTEVSRIVLRGEGDRTRQRKPTSVLGLGYSEDSVDSGTSAMDGAEDTAAPSARPPESANASRVAAMSEMRSDTEAKPKSAGTRALWISAGGALMVSVIAGIWVVRQSASRQ